MTLAEPCWRCGADMHWVHGTWQCPHCRFKLGCCEGDTGETAGVPAACERRAAAYRGESEAARPSL